MWLVGIIAGLVFAVGVVLLNIQKYVVIAATALLGAGIIVGTFLFLFGGLPPAELTGRTPCGTCCRRHPSGC